MRHSLTRGVPFLLKNNMNLIGQSFGRLKVIELYSRGKNSKWKCSCACGTKKVVIACDLRSGNTKSCGCLAKEMISKRSTTHGMFGTRPYNIWNQMKLRCKKNYFQRKFYFDKGIIVCDKWKTFESFWSDMKYGYADHLTIDRIDNTKGYSKENCRWATPSEQNANKSTNRLITFNGDTKPLVIWSKELGFKYEKVRKRLNRGWSFERAISL